MANSVDINIKLKQQLETSSKQAAELQQKGAFKGDLGAKQWSKVQGLLTQLNAFNLDKLEGKELTNFINKFAELRRVMDNAAVSVGKYSEEYIKQNQKVAAVQERLNNIRAKQAKNSSQRKQALEQVKTNLEAGSYVFKKTSTKGNIPITNPDTILDAYSKGNLSAFENGFSGKRLKGDELSLALAKIGLSSYGKHTEESQRLKEEIKAEQVNLSTQQLRLEKIPLDTNNENAFTQEVLQSSRVIAETSGQAQEGQVTQNEKDINSTLNTLNIEGLQAQNSLLGKAFKQFTIYNVILRTVKRALKEAVVTIQDLDKALTEQAMTTGKTRQETYALLSTYQDLAAQTGATTKEVANIAAEYMRQGKTTSEAITLTKAAISAAKVAGISSSESINYLTTALNGFRLSAEEAMNVSDKFAAVAAASATSYDEIAIALSKVASQANLAGMSIGYTTALLSKGLETTREAPETIGTALKTIIARMRELTDYGSTLEGDTDVNNVETQLAYIGIALKNQNGELRSTEEVLDDLGKKWDTLNTNQQAAIAKALAGTRQQSRLIAMMDDYERVTELQDIAQRSAGATMAQMSTYMEGMEAALNRVNVAWEKIVTAFTNSDVIASLTNGLANMMDWIGNILNHTWAMVGAVTIIAAAGLNILNRKILEKKISDQILANDLAQKKVKITQAIEQQKNLVAEKAQLLIDQQQLKISQQELIVELQKKQAKGEVLTADEQALLTAYQQQVFLEQQNNLLDIQSGNVGMLAGAWGGFVLLIQGGLKYLVAMGSTLKTIISLTNKATRAKVKENIQNKLAAIFGTAEGAAKTGAWVIAAGILAAAGIAVAVMASKGVFKSDAEKTNNKINSLNSEIYNLTKTAQSLNTITSSFDDIDKKLIKTNDDLKEMNDLLAQAKDSLSDEELTDFNSKATNTEKIAYLKELTAAKNAQSLQKYQEQLKIINRMNSKEKNKLYDTSDTTYSETRSAITQGNNIQLYNAIDNFTGLTSQEKKAVESLAQSMLAELDVQEALNYAQSPEKFTELIKNLTKTKVTVDGINVSLAEVLDSSDYGFAEKLRAYQTGLTSLTNAELEAFKKVYAGYEILNNFDTSILQFFDQQGYTIDMINKLYTGWEDIAKVNNQMTEQYYQETFTNLLENLRDYDNDISLAIKNTYSELLKSLSGDEFENTWNSIVNTIGKVITKGVLNLSQESLKFSNTIGDFYEKANKWSTLSSSEQAQFLSDNAAYFAGDAELYKAFQTNDYQKIEEALKNNNTLNEQRLSLINEINTELNYQLALQGDQRNESYISFLRDQLKLLEDTSIYQADLNLRLEQQNSQLEYYKKFLEKEQDALTESLNKRKEAYQDYFDTINEQEEQTTYEEDAQKLITNLSRLGSSTNTDARVQAAELEKELRDLETERLQSLREKAQDQILSNIDDEITNISDNLSALLENSQLMYQMMLQDMNDPVGFVSNMLRASGEGLTELGVENLLKDLSVAFGSAVNFDDIQTAISTDAQGNIIVNVGDETINLTSAEGSDIRAIIQKILQQSGKR